MPDAASDAHLRTALDAARDTHSAAETVLRGAELARQSVVAVVADTSARESVVSLAPANKRVWIA